MAKNIAAYMDGEMSRGRGTGFRNYHAKRPLTPAAEFERLQEVNSLLKGAYNEVLAEPVPLAVASRVHADRGCAGARYPRLSGSRRRLAGGLGIAGNRRFVCWR